MGEYSEAIMQLVEVIMFEYNQNRENQQLQLMCIRGLLLLMHHESFTDYGA